jgi:hypothetical protein
MRRLPLVPRLFLLPTTSLIDKILLPPKRIDLDFYDDARYFLGGFHVVVCFLEVQTVNVEFFSAGSVSSLFQL